MLIHHHPNISLFVEPEYQMKMHIFNLQHTGISKQVGCNILSGISSTPKYPNIPKLLILSFCDIPGYFEVSANLKSPKYCFSLLLVEKKFCPVLILLAGKMFLWYPFDFIVESNLCGHKTGFKRMSRWKNIDVAEQPPNKNRC